MRTKIIAMVLLAGGSMFAEGRATFPDPGHTGMARRMSRSDRPNSRVPGIRGRGLDVRNRFGRLGC